MPHEHVTESGNKVKCYHPTIDVLFSWKFWLGMTIGFPLEHLLWLHTWPLSIIGQWMAHAH